MYVIIIAHIGHKTLNLSPSTSLIIIQCVQKVTVHLQKVLEVMSKSVYTDLNLFNPFAY
jgi:hypothetical protein